VRAIKIRFHIAISFSFLLRSEHFYEISKTFDRFSNYVSDLYGIICARRRKIDYIVNLCKAGSKAGVNRSRAVSTYNSQSWRRSKFDAWKWWRSHCHPAWRRSARTLCYGSSASDLDVPCIVRNISKDRNSHFRRSR